MPGVPRFQERFDHIPAGRAELNDWLAYKLRPMFEECVLTIGEDIMFK